MFGTRRLTAKTAAAIAVIALASLGTMAASAAEMITVCGTHSAGASTQSGKSDFQLSRLLRLSAEGVSAIGNVGIKKASIVCGPGAPISLPWS
jgi:hypothetical protein